MKHTRRETFFWLEAARRLDGARPVPKSQRAELDRVRESQDLACSIVIALLRREVSIDELDRKENERGEMRSGRLRLSVRKVALSAVGATGRADDRTARFALWQGIITDNDVKRAVRKRKRRPEADAERIASAARFLAEYWCGDRGVYGQAKTAVIFFPPPLCLFTNKALADFLALCFPGQDFNETGIRKWISRLRLIRPATAPKIREVKSLADGICFCP